MQINRSDIEKLYDGDNKLEVIEILDLIFNSIVRQVVDNKVVQDYEYFDSWKHRTDDLVEEDMGQLQIDRQQLLNALSLYLEKDYLNNKALNWVFLNILTYAEYLATQIEIRKKILGLDKFLVSIYPPKSEHVVGISPLKKISFFNGLLILIAILIGFSIHLFLGTIFLAYFVMNRFLAYKNLKKVDEFLFKMYRTYNFVKSHDLNWHFVEEVYKDNFKDNILWDTQIYSLIEKSK